MTNNPATANAYIDALSACGVRLTAMLQRGVPVGVCYSLLDSHDAPERAQTAMAEWNAACGDNKALAAALLRRGDVVEIDT